MIWPLDLSAVLLPIVDAAVHTLGLWAIVPMLLAGLAFEIRRKFLAQEAEIAALRHQIAELQERRLQDAKAMIRIAETGTQATTSRTRSDERFADILEAVLRREQRAGLFGWRR